MKEEDKKYDTQNENESQEDIKAQHNRFQITMVQMLSNASYFFRALADQFQGDKDQN